MKILIFALSMALPFFSHASDDSCVESLGAISAAAQIEAKSFVEPVICRGTFVDELSGKEMKISIDLNSYYDADPEWTETRHKTLVEAPGFWGTKKSFYLHQHWGANCVQRGSLVTCSGYGLGDGAVDFKIIVDLATKRATGFYKEFVRSTGTITRHLKFGANSPIECFVGSVGAH